jgi:hypothetical protein
VLKTIKDAFPTLPQNEHDLVAISDELWKLGSLEEIKEKVSPELFIAHVSMNMIGNAQCDGWEYGIIPYHSQLLPYIPQALDVLHLPDIKEAFQNVIALFRKFVTSGTTLDKLYCDEQLYNDVVGFLQDATYKVKDERLSGYNKEEHVQLSEEFHRCAELLDNLTDSAWGYSSPGKGWYGVLNYIKENYNTDK